MLKLTVIDGAAGAEVANRTPGTLRVAFATQDLHTLDAHFAGARNFAIYDVSPEGHQFVSAVRFDGASREDGIHDDHNDRLLPRLQALDGCSLLFVLAIGGPAAARVVSARIHPIKLPAPEPIGDILARLQVMLNGTPPPWLRRVMHSRPLAFLDEEDEA